MKYNPSTNRFTIKAWVIMKRLPVKSKWTQRDRACYKAGLNTQMSLL
jgi:hypothetical protein